MQNADRIELVYVWAERRSHRCKANGGKRKARQAVEMVEFPSEFSFVGCCRRVTGASALTHTHSHGQRERERESMQIVPTTRSHTHAQRQRQRSLEKEKRERENGFRRRQQQRVQRRARVHGAGHSASTGNWICQHTALSLSLSHAGMRVCVCT